MLLPASKTKQKTIGPVHHFRFQHISTSAYAENLGMSHSQRFHMGILLHVLYSNPKVLYAPNNTEVDEIIRKVTTTHAQGMRTSACTCAWVVLLGRSTCMLGG